MESRVRTTGSFDVGNGPVKQPADLQSLTSFEYAMVHEWRHADVFGPRYHINDSFGNILGRPDGLQMYGASNCREWAWVQFSLIIGREYRGAVQKELP
jgi:hypothetical protein